MAIGMLTGDSVVCISPEATLVDAASRLTDRDIGALVVGTEDEVLGIVSERDIVRAVARGSDLATTFVQQIATTELVWADVTASVAEVAEEMAERWVRHILIEDDGRLAGIVSARDLLATQAMEESQAD